MKEIKFGFSHFNLQNTPALAQKIGNLGLICALIGVAILAIPDTFSEDGFQVALPHFAIIIAKGLIGIGSLTKFVTKLFGQIETTINGINSQINK